MVDDKNTTHYFLDVNPEEAEQLELSQEIISDRMERALWAPIDLSQLGLKILASATASGTDITPPLTHDEITLTAAVILIAGSETSAKVLSGAAYNLTRNPSVQRKAAAEVRAAFVSDKDSTLLSLARLAYCPL